MNMIGAKKCGTAKKKKGKPEHAMKVEAQPKKPTAKKETKTTPKRKKSVATTKK